MQKFAVMLFAAVSMAVFSVVTVAGYTQPAPVTITLEADGSGTAIGDMVTARFSDNDVEVIGCGIRVYDDGAGGTFQYGFCQATDEMETRGFCSTMRPEILDIMKATGDYSFITFAWDAAGECTHVGFSTQSFYIPEHVGKTKGKKK